MKGQLMKLEVPHLAVFLVGCGRIFCLIQILKMLCRVRVTHTIRIVSRQVVHQAASNQIQICKSTSFGGLPSGLRERSRERE
jgi:hypothetical protein